MPEITIGVPFYNCERYILNTIRSIYAQSFTDWEAIFIDDGSTDNSLNIVNSINDSRVRVFSDEINLGIGARRKQIVELAKGKYLAWQDADDMMHPERLMIQYDFITNRNDIDILDTSYFTIDPKLNILRLLEKTEGFVNPDDMIRFPSLTNGTSIAKTEVYKKFNYDEKLRRSEDWDVWLKALDNCKYYHIKDILYYRVDADTNQKPRMSRELIGPKNNTNIYIRYGFKYMGGLQCIKLIMRLYIRAFYRITLILVGQHKRFKAEQTNTLTPKTKTIAELGLQQILKTKIPGIDY